MAKSSKRKKQETQEEQDARMERRRKRGGRKKSAQKKAQIRIRQKDRDYLRTLGITPENNQCGQPLLYRHGKICTQGRYIHRVYDEEGNIIKRFRAKTCFAHLSDELKKKLDIKTQVGRPERPVANDVLREMIEGNMAAWLEPYWAAVTEGIKPIVVGNGPHARIEEYRDLRGAIQAVESVLDRVYGKPTQRQELTGAVEFSEVEVPADKDRQKEVARILAENGALGIIAASKNPASQN